MNWSGIFQSARDISANFCLFIFYKVLIQVIKSHTQASCRANIAAKHSLELIKETANLVNRQIRSHTKVYKNFCNPLFVFSLKGNLIYSAKLYARPPITFLLLLLLFAVIKRQESNGCPQLIICAEVCRTIPLNAFGLQNSHYSTQESTVAHSLFYLRVYDLEV